MKIKDAKKPCKMGAGTRGLGRRPWEPRTERPALIWGLFAGASRGGKGGNRCSPRLQAARFPTPPPARRASAAPSPLLPLAPGEDLGGAREIFDSCFTKRDCIPVLSWSQGGKVVGAPS